MSTLAVTGEPDLGLDPGLVAAARAARRSKVRTRVASWLILVLLIGVWQLLGATDHSVATLFSTPQLVAQRVGQIATNGVLWANLLPTLEETLGGLVIGMVVGIVGGFVMASSKAVGAIFDPYVVGINGLPRVALGPFFVVWFGIGIASKVLLAASIVFVVVLFNIREGTESIDGDLVDALRSMRASRWTMARHLIIPSLTPWLLASVKIGIGLALTGAVVGELVGANAGLGWYITNSLNVVDITGAITALLLMAVLAMVMYYLVLAVERRVLRWRATSGGR